MARTISSQSLDTRTVLPSPVAYLRETYPQASWQQHDNFGDLASSWLHIHEALRSEGAQLRQITEEFRDGKRTAADFRLAFPPRMTQYLQHLNGHHQVEDHFYFPKFRAIDQNMVAGFDLLEGDHKSSRQVSNERQELSLIYWSKTRCVSTCSRLLFRRF